MAKKVLDTLSYGIYLATSSFENKDAGCVINSLQQATSSFPQKFIITLNKFNFTREIAEKSGFITVTVLSQQANKEIINEFGFKSSRVVDKFSKFDVARDGNGIPYLKDAAVAVLSMRIMDQMDLGSHIAYACEIMSSELLSDDEPLTAAFYKDMMSGKTAPNAPTFRTLENSYRCTVCGYIYKSDSIADDYRCPICGAPADKFVKV